MINNPKKPFGEIRGVFFVEGEVQSFLPLLRTMADRKFPFSLPGGFGGRGTKTPKTPQGPTIKPERNNGFDDSEPQAAEPVESNDPWEDERTPQERKRAFERAYVQWEKKYGVNGPVPFGVSGKGVNYSDPYEEEFKSMMEQQSLTRMDQVKEFFMRPDVQSLILNVGMNVALFLIFRRINATQKVNQGLLTQIANILRNRR